MTDEPTDDDVWRMDTLRGEDSKAKGSAYTHEFHHGHTVAASVTSYRYSRGGETRMNHVPHVVVSGPDGSIVAEPEARDESDPVRAIENAKSLARDVYENPSNYL